MSKTITLTPALSLPLDIVTMRTAEYGDSGAGKTAFARLLAEHVHAAHHRFCAIDLKNDWYGLKSSADGAAAGIPVVIFGGPRGDVKLFDDSGAAASLADTVASIEQSVIVDLDALSRTRQERFLAVFLDRLYEANRRPLLLFCDEADRYAPQKPMTQDAILSLSSSEDIARRGRKRGIGSFWLTQRTAVLNKNVSDLCNMTVVFRTPGSRDLAELEDRVGRIADKATVKEVMKEAPGLADGQAFFLSSHPKLRKYMPDPVRPVQLPLPWTFDSSATPGVGQRRREPKVLAKTDLAAIESKMAAQVERAKSEDPAALRQQVAKLKAELHSLQVERDKLAAREPAGKEKRVEVPVITPKQFERLEKLHGKIDSRFAAASGRAETLFKPITELLLGARGQIGELLATAGAIMKSNGQTRVEAYTPRVAAPVPPPRVTAPERVHAATPKPVTAVEPTAGRGELSGPELKILDAYAWWHSIGVAKPARENIAPLAGYTNIRSSGFRNPLYACQSRGLVQDDALTDAGAALAAWPDRPDTLEKYHEKLMAVLDGPEQKLFKALRDVNVRWTRQELATATGYENVRSSGFRNPLYRLSSMGLVELQKGDAVVATDLMFPASLTASGGNR